MEGKIKIYTGATDFKERLLAEVPLNTSRMLTMESITADSSADAGGEVSWAYFFNDKEESYHTRNSETGEWVVDYYHKFTLWERIKRWFRVKFGGDE